MERNYAIRTKRGALRRYNALLNEANRRLAGGTQFGIDWPTLRICCPDIYNEIQDIKTAYPGLPA